MSGTLRERKPGTWEIRFEIGLDPATRQRRQLSRIVQGTERQANEALRREIAAVRKGRYRGTSTKFAVICAKWLELQSHNLGQSAVQQCENILTEHVFPTLGNRPINLIHAVDLENLYRHLVLRKRLSHIEIKSTDPVTGNTGHRGRDANRPPTNVRSGAGFALDRTKERL